MYYSNICMLRIEEESHTKVELTTRNLCLHWSFLLQARRGWVNFLKLQHRKEKKIWSWLNVGSRCSKFFISIALYLTESPFASISFPKVIYFWLVGIQFSSSLWFTLGLYAGYLHLPTKHLLKYSATDIYLTLTALILFPVLCCQFYFLWHVVWS